MVGVRGRINNKAKAGCCTASASWHLDRADQSDQGLLCFPTYMLIVPCLECVLTYCCNCTCLLDI